MWHSRYVKEHLIHFNPICENLNWISQLNKLFFVIHMYTVTVNMVSLWLICLVDVTCKGWIKATATYLHLGTQRALSSNTQCKSEVWFITYLMRPKQAYFVENSLRGGCLLKVILKNPWQKNQRKYLCSRQRHLLTCLHFYMVFLYYARLVQGSCITVLFKQPLHKFLREYTHFGLIW